MLAERLTAGRFWATPSALAVAMSLDTLALMAGATQVATGVGGICLILWQPKKLRWLIVALFAITGLVGVGATVASTARANEAQRTVQEKLTELVERGLLSRDQWQLKIDQGGTEDAQRACASTAEQWEQGVEGYLQTIPRGAIYVGRFLNSPRGQSYPPGLAANFAVRWDLLSGELARLNEFMLDPDLGKP